MAPMKSVIKHPQTTAEESSKKRRMKHHEDVSPWTEKMIEEQASSPTSTRQILSMAMCPIISG